MSYQIRLATPEDAPGISRVVIAALRESNSLDYLPQVIAEVEISFTPKAVEAMFEKRRVLVAVVGEQIIGTASLEGGVVRSVFVRPIFQKRGVGKVMMGILHAMARSQGMRRLSVPSSITAVGFYEKMGYETVRYEFHGSERTVVMKVDL